MQTLYRPFLSQLSRREFLKITGQSAAALFTLPHLDLGPSDAVGEQPTLGRVTDKSVVLYDQPSFDGKLKRIYWQDLVFPITGVKIGMDPAHNRIWYEVNHEGYIHSGSIQPVKIDLNPPVESTNGQDLLAEVTVPFTDVYQSLDQNEVVYRMYYQTTHWVLDVAKDAQGKIWYQIWDDAQKNKTTYWVDGRHLRILQPFDVTPLSPEVPDSDKRIEVHLADQVAIAFEGDNPVFVTRMSSGAKWSSGNYSTPSGDFMTYFKRPSRHMASGSPAAATGYDLPGIPWVSYITESGISFHGTYWHNDFGRPRSHGCMNLPSDAARWIYRWTNPTVPYDEKWMYKLTGTLVQIS